MLPAECSDSLRPLASEIVSQKVSIGLCVCCACVCVCVCVCVEMRAYVELHFVMMYKCLVTYCSYISFRVKEENILVKYTTFYDLFF